MSYGLLILITVFFLSRGLVVPPDQLENQAVPEQRVSKAMTGLMVSLGARYYC